MPRGRGDIKSGGGVTFFSTIPRGRKNTIMSPLPPRNVTPLVRARGDIILGSKPLVFGLKNNVTPCHPSNPLNFWEKGKNGQMSPLPSVRAKTPKYVGS